MTQRIDYMKRSPELFKKFVDFSMALKQSAIEESIRDLVDIRASQINGCAFCVDLHVKEATMHGERALRLHHVATWRESSLFNKRERAALEWTEVLTKSPADAPGVRIVVASPDGSKSYRGRAKRRSESVFSGTERSDIAADDAAGE